MAGTWIPIGGGMTGYLAVPSSGSGPGWPGCAAGPIPAWWICNA